MFSNSQLDQTVTNTEPMIVSSGNSPGSSYLPGFLIGDTHSSFTAASPRLWSMASSPSKQRSPSPSNPTFPVNVAQKSSSTPRAFGGRLAGEKAGGPPVQSLFDSFSSPARSDSLSLVGVISNRTSPVEIESSSSFRDSSQIEDLEPDDTWVTVFGFPPGATSYILQQFSQYGTVLEHRHGMEQSKVTFIKERIYGQCSCEVISGNLGHRLKVAPNGNWVHLHYQSKLQAKKALSKNGKVFSDSIMVGVKPCTDKISITRTKNFHDESSKENIPVVNSILSPERAGIRPLTQAYRASAYDREVTITPPARVPQKNGGLVSKAMEYVFSW